jgi:hypothetical protein
MSGIPFAFSPNMKFINVGAEVRPFSIFWIVIFNIEDLQKFIKKNNWASGLETRLYD